MKEKLKMSEKKLGIIGGMGPKATSVFFDNIVNKTVAKCDNEHINMVVLNNTKIPDRTKAIKSRKFKNILREFLNAIRELEYLKVDNIAIPCNTACVFIKELQKYTNIPIINMVEETAKFISENVEKENIIVGILATDGTIESRIYQEELQNYNIKSIIPDKEMQLKIMDLIYNHIKRKGDGEIDVLEEIINKMVALGCDYVILGCTELSYFNYKYDIPNSCIDPLEILTKIAIELSDKEYKGDLKKL